MSLTEHGSRKRYRTNYEDEVSEFTPLSKRINNLHINNAVFPVPKLVGLPDKGEPHKAVIESNARLSDLHCGGTRSVDAQVTMETWHIQQYNPDLTPSENPYYYESNRLLYDLYVQRISRSGGLPH